jgi:hypothetical protein
MHLDVSVRQSDTPKCKDLLSRINADPAGSWLNRYLKLQTERGDEASAATRGQRARAGREPRKERGEASRKQRRRTRQAGKAPVTRVRYGPSNTSAAGVGPPAVLSPEPSHRRQRTGIRADVTHPDGQVNRSEVAWPITGPLSMATTRERRKHHVVCSGTGARP